MSSLFGGVKEFFGLDIGSTGIRLVQLSRTGQPHTLLRYAFTPIDPKISLSDSKNDTDKLAAEISKLVGQSRLTTRDVAVGLPSTRVFTTVVDIDRLPNDELAKAIRYQADSIIPTPLAESKIDWAVLGDSPVDKTKVELLLTSVSNSYVESRLDMLESIGLNVIAFEPDGMAISRSLAPVEAASPQLILDIGRKSTDLVINMNGTPRLTRSIPTGMEILIKTASQTLNIDEVQAEQFILKFGVSQEKLEGQIYQSISGTIDLLITEIEKSVKFFQSRYVDMKVERMILTGGASVIPEFPLFIANKFGVNVEIGNAWRNVAYSKDRQNELLGLANHFSVAVGLAEREA